MPPLLKEIVLGHYEKSTTLSMENKVIGNNYQAWSLRRNIVTAAIVLACACGWETSHAQGTASQPQATEQTPATDDTPRGKLLAFTENTAAAAGALSVCNPRAYTEARLCGVLIITRWQELGQSMPQDGDMAEAVENTWQKSAGHARDIQAGSSPPLTCTALLEKSRTLRLWELCAAARRLEVQAAAGKTPNASGRPNNQSSPQSQARPNPNGVDVFRMQ